MGYQTFGIVLEETGRQLVASPLLPRLRLLNLGECGITGRGAQLLAAAAPRLSRLEALYLARNRIGDMACLGFLGSVLVSGPGSQDFG